MTVYYFSPVSAHVWRASRRVLGLPCGYSGASKLDDTGECMELDLG